MKNRQLTIGFVPGVLIGAKIYKKRYKTDYVLYLLFIDICLTLYK